MELDLTRTEARVLGCLVEKDLATPEYYPLTLNALTNACNQKSNRHPVMSLSTTEVQAGIDGLMKKHYVTDRTGFGSRVAKYSHRFCNSHFGQLHLSGAEYAVICELLVRGPQTPGELRTHGSRMHPFKEVAEVDRVLQELADRDEPLVVRLPREPGRRECRWTQLFTGEPEEAGDVRDEAPPTATPGETAPDALARVAALEQAMGELAARLDELCARVERLGPPAESGAWPASEEEREG